MTTDDYWTKRYPPRRAVHGGIESRSKRGTFGKTWWSRALIFAVEQHADAGRMSRGRTYARAGQVVSMQTESGAVVAEVQGSQPQPFISTFAIRTLDDSQVDELIDTVRDTPGMLAEIVSGSLPANLGPLLLPEDASDLDYDCTCPDLGFPCKHVAAVAYLVAERLDNHPLDILTLRGLDLDTLIIGVERTPTALNTDDFYGDTTVLPALPTPDFRPAVDDLDPIPLRAALRLLTPDERAIATALSDLTSLYRTKP